MNKAEQIKQIFKSRTEIPAQHRLDATVEQTEFLINGELRIWDGPFEKVRSPICIAEGADLAPAVIGSYPLLSGKQAEMALAAAVTAYDFGRGQWPTMSVEARIRCVEDFVLLMQEQREEVVRLLMWEIAKPYAAAAKEFDRTVDYIRDTVDALKELDRISSRFVIESGIVAQIRRAPLGVTLCMGPSNYPLNETFTTLIPALLMGNTIIFKPPRIGVLLHRPLLKAFAEAFPAGVVNTVYGEGREVVGPIMRSGRVDCLAFIGSSRVADILRAQHPKLHRLRCVLGLEAKNPGIVLQDADLDIAVRECVSGSLSFNGQRCTAIKIIFVHESVAEAFIGRFCDAVDNLKIGLPWEEGAAITPLEPDRTSYFEELVADAKARDAEIVNTAGGTVCGTFFYPAVVYPVRKGMRLYSEEQFGPVVAITPFSDISEPIQYMVESDYGQQVSIFGNDPDEIADLLDPLVNQVCRVNLNSQCQRGPDTFPFTGRKDSAEGTLSVSDALRVFTIRTLVAAQGNDLNKNIINRIVRERKSKFLSDDFIL